jgi:hypothetical protein
MMPVAVAKSAEERLQGAPQRRTRARAHHRHRSGRRKRNNVAPAQRDLAGVIGA